MEAEENVTAKNARRCRIIQAYKWAPFGKKIPMSLDMNEGTEPSAHHTFCMVTVLKLICIGQYFMFFYSVVLLSKYYTPECMPGIIVYELHS